MDYNVFLQMGGGSSQMIMLVLVIGVFYFFMIRPQMKKQKEESKFRSTIEKGDKVVTVGGIHGKVISTQDTTVMLEVDSGRMKIEKNAISKEYSKSGDKKTEEKK